MCGLWGDISHEKHAGGFSQILSHRNHQVTVYHWISNPVTEISSWPNLSFQWKYCNWSMKDGLERLEWEQKKNFQISTPSGCLFCFDYGTSRETGRWLHRKHSSTFLLNCGILDEHCATCVAQQWLCGRRFIFVDPEPNGRHRVGDSEKCEWYMLMSSYMF